MNAVTRTWVQIDRAHLPPGGMCVQGWMALEGGSAVASIFEVVAEQAKAGQRFMLCYHVLGELRPRVERFGEFTAAQERANKTLSNCKVIPRAAPGMVGKRGHH